MGLVVHGGSYCAASTYMHVVRPTVPVVGRTALNLAVACALHSGHDVFNALDIFENEKILKGKPPVCWWAAALLHVS